MFSDGDMLSYDEVDSSGNGIHGMTPESRLEATVFII